MTLRERILGVAVLILLVAAGVLLVLAHNLRDDVAQTQRDTLVNRQIGSGNRDLLCDIRGLVTTGGKQAGTALCRVAPKATP